MDAGRVMPPRPVPTSSPTVLITMPMETQLLAIQYMAAMQAPQPGDAPADPDYGKTIADAFRPLGKTDVISSGRLIEVKMEKGCDATLPKSAVARYTGATLGRFSPTGCSSCAAATTRCSACRARATRTTCSARASSCRYGAGASQVPTHALPACMQATWAPS